MSPIDQYSALAGVPLTRGKIEAQSVGTGVTTTMDVPVGGSDFVTVMADMTAAATGDMAVTVIPYEADGITLGVTALPAVPSVGYVSTLSGGHARFIQQYNVQGIDKVQIQLKNNNAGTQTITRLSWRTASW